MIFPIRFPINKTVDQYKLDILSTYLRIKKKKNNAKQDTLICGVRMPSQVIYLFVLLSFIYCFATYCLCDQLGGAAVGIDTPLGRFCR